MVDRSTTRSRRRSPVPDCRDGPKFQIVDPIPGDSARAIELIRRYADLGLGFVDASIIALAERLGVTTIATIDRRDFAVVRPTHCDAFELIP